MQDELEDRELRRRLSESDVVQEAYIRRLKLKIHQLKSLNIADVTKGIRREEN